MIETAQPIGFDWPKIKQQVRSASKGTKLFFILLALMIFNITWYLPLPTHATGTNMYMFWDPGNGAIPTNWCEITSVDGYFPRGTQLTGFTFPGLTSGITRPANPGVASTTVGAPSTTADGNGGGSAVSAATHVHAFSVTPAISNDFNANDPSNPDIPLYRSLKLMEYASGTAGSCTGSGIPNVIPQHSIGLFDTLPTDGSFTAYTSNNGKMIKVDSSVTNGGSDIERNTLTFPALNACTTTCSTNRATFLASIATATTTHTNNAPTSVSCTSGCNGTGCVVNNISTPATSTTYDCEQASDPAYVQPILGEAASSTPTLSVNITAMFDGDPGGGWQILSNSGGIYNNKFLRPASSANFTSVGVDTRPAITVGGTTASATGGSGGATTNTLGLGTVSSQQTHTHTLTMVSGTVTNDNVPPYFTVIIAQKVSFVLQSYRFYIDPVCASSCANTVSDPWPTGSLDIAEKTGLPAIPAQYIPPDAQAHTQLRLRVQILVSAQALVTNTTAFTLQYAKTNYDDCVSDAGVWADIPNNGSAGDWTYGSDNVPDNGTLTGSPVLAGSTTLELFSKSTSGTPTKNPNSAAVGNTIEYDWLIQDNTAQGATQYAFRPVQTDGVNETLLSYYGTTLGSHGYNSTCPIVVTMPSVDQQLRHGEFFQTNSATGSDPDQGFEWVN